MTASADVAKMKAGISAQVCPSAVALIVLPSDSKGGTSWLWKDSGWDRRKRGFYSATDRNVANEVQAIINFRIITT